jgi:hypothetical protein
MLVKHTREYRWEPCFRKSISGSLFVLGRADSNFSLIQLCEKKLRTSSFFQDSKGRLPENLPSSYVSGWYIEKIDASDSLLVILVNDTLNRYANPLLYYYVI